MLKVQKTDFAMCVDMCVWYVYGKYLMNDIHPFVKNSDG